jgi:Domain of unknown function (DUF4382)
MTKKSFIIVLLSGLVFLFRGCSENDQNAVLKVRLTDAPGDYEQVLIDIQDVQVHVADSPGEGSWKSLDVNKGIYNLLDFRNGMDTLLASIELPAGNVSQMRLVLGSENKIMVDSVLQDLETPSAQQSGLKFNIHANLVAGIVYTLWIDFDAARSIVHNGNGKYSLKPVIRTYNEASSGAISGVVSPTNALPYVMAVSNDDTLGCYAGEDGVFLLKGIPKGTYLVSFAPVDPYLPLSVENVMVNNGEVTVMDTVYFNQ